MIYCDPQHLQVESIIFALSYKRNRESLPENPCRKEDLDELLLYHHE